MCLKTHTSDGGDCLLKGKANVILLHCLSPSAGRCSDEGLTRKNREKIQHNTKVAKYKFIVLLK